MKKIKKVVIMLLASVAALILASCGTGSSDNTEPAALDSLVIYTSHKEDVYSPIIKEFQERTGIHIDIVAGGTGEILMRIEMDTEFGDPLGDVMFGGGVESLEAYKDYFQPYVSLEDDNIGEAFKAKDNTWTGFSALPMVIMYNKNLVAEDDVPTSWADLIDPKWKGKIAYTDPALSGSCYTIMVTMLTAYPEGDHGWDFMRAFAANLDGKILENSSDIFKGVADGEYSLGLTLEEAAQKYLVTGADVGFIYPSEGTSAVPDGTAIIKGGPNPENAKAFLDFSVSEDVQNLIVTNMSRRSVRNDVDPAKGLAPLSDIKLVDYDVSAASTDKENLLKKWKDILY